VVHDSQGHEELALLEDCNQVTNGDYNIIRRQCGL
jgi:hypothetical protein